MEQICTLPEILKYYIYAYKEIISTLVEKKLYIRKIICTFDNPGIVEYYSKEIDKYLNNARKELEILKFMINNERKLYTTDIWNVLDKFDENFEKRYKYYQDFCENVDDAIDLERDYKIWAPEVDYQVYTDNYVNALKEYLKGFNKDRVKEFLHEERVVNEDDFDAYLKNATIIDTDAKISTNIYGIYDKKVVVPKIKDEESTLVNIHEMVHLELLNDYEEMYEKWIIFGEDLPIFYELLFKEQNKFVRSNLHVTDKALELLKNYNNEPFVEQIMKLERMR